MLNIKGRELHGGGKLHFKITFVHIGKDPTYSAEIESDRSYSAVEETTYQLREGNAVILYQV